MSTPDATTYPPSIYADIAMAGDGAVRDQATEASDPTDENPTWTPAPLGGTNDSVIAANMQHNALGLIFDAPTPIQSGQNTPYPMAPPGLPAQTTCATNPNLDAGKNGQEVTVAGVGQKANGDDGDRGRPRKRTRANSSEETVRGDATLNLQTGPTATIDTTTSTPHTPKPVYTFGSTDSRVRFAFDNPPGTLDLDRPTARPGTPHPGRPSSRRAMISPARASSVSMARGIHRPHPYRQLIFGSFEEAMTDAPPRAPTPPLEYYPPSPPRQAAARELPEEGQMFYGTPRAQNREVADDPPLGTPHLRPHPAQLAHGREEENRHRYPDPPITGPSRLAADRQNDLAERPTTPPGMRYEHVSELPENAWNRLMSAIEQNVISGWPGMLRGVTPPPFSAWPEGRKFLRHNRLRKTATLTPNHPRNAPANPTADHDMEVDRPPAAPPAHPVLQAQPALLANPAPIPPLPAQLPPLPIDVQNLVITHRALPHGGRLTNTLYPLPRPHLHGAAMIQPPIDIAHTQEPDGGFYRIRRDHPEGALAGVENEKVRFWMEREKKTTMIAEIYLGDTVREGESWHATQTVRELLEQLTGRNDFTIIHAEIPNNNPPFDPDNIHTRNPRALFVGDLEAQWVTTLCAIQTLSTKKVTIHCFPADLRIDDFLGRIVGFAHNVNGSIERIITEKVNSDPIRTIIAKHVQKNPFRNHEPVAVATQRIVNSLRVRIEELPPTGQLAAFAYMDSPADTIDGWERWKKDMTGVRWDSVDNGTGFMRPVGPCRGCNSAEHTAHHCPFPDTPGWLGPIPPEKAHPERGFPSRGTDTRGRGGGRGRGRGFRGARPPFA
ncbi:hypothetical protein LXA43DRAFT_1069657 [Ganoderma leucocontextum]|nr:hypothetical protein LXA43DRAFT_1069657 [Ganoderma leucocontextum]